MDYFVYLVFRVFTALVLGAAVDRGLPTRGRLLGLAGAGYVAAPYRRLVVANLTVAYGASKSPAEIRQPHAAPISSRSARISFPASRPSGPMPPGSTAVCPVEGIEHAIAALDQGKGIVMVLSHMGNWELYAPLCQVLPAVQMVLHLSAARQQVHRSLRPGVPAAGPPTMFNRKNGFNGPTAFLRAGGAVGVLIDQHAGDHGVWSPLFGRLASTSTLAGLLAQPHGRDSWYRWPWSQPDRRVGSWSFSHPCRAWRRTARPWRSKQSPRVSTQVLERQVNTSPADWFWGSQPLENTEAEIPARHVSPGHRATAAGAPPPPR